LSGDGFAPKEVMIIQTNVEIQVERTRLGPISHRLVADLSETEVSADLSSNGVNVMRYQ